MPQFDRFCEVITRFPKDTLFHHGKCIGADEETNNYLRLNGFKTVGHPPINHKYLSACEVDFLLPAKEYIARNHDIVDTSVTLIVAPREAFEVTRSGTWATYRYAKTQKKHIIVIYLGGEMIEIGG